jgi:NAD(P)-dependent dehydrogenase (short-subunit alcohol dehydrogenase family)
MADYYDNKAVFITGGSSGIGLAFARALAARGAHIAIFARSRDKLDGAREDIAGQCANPGQSVKAYTLDVEKIDTINPQLRSALDELGVPDMLVSCAGGGIAKSFEDHHLADFSYNFKYQCARYIRLCACAGAADEAQWGRRYCPYRLPGWPGAGMGI